MEKTKFDTILVKLIKAKPKPRKEIETKGKRGPSALSKPRGMSRRLRA